MPENIIERHDISADKAAIANAATFLGRQDQDFGIQETAIYFYNTSALEFNGGRPPNHPHMLILACPKGQPYIIARGSTEEGRHRISLCNHFWNATGGAQTQGSLHDVVVVR